MLKFEGSNLDELEKVEIDNKYKIGNLIYIGSCGYLFEVSNISQGDGQQLVIKVTHDCEEMRRQTQLLKVLRHQGKLQFG